MLAAALLLVLLPSQAAEVRLAELSDLQLAERIPPQSRQWVEDPTTGTISLHPVVAELRRRFESGDALDLECWTTILVRHGYLRWRKRWPEDRGFAVSLHAPALTQGLAIELVPDEPGWRSAHARHWEMMCGLGMASMWDFEDYQELGDLRPDQHEVRFAVVLLLPEWTKAPALAGRVRVGTFPIEVTPVSHVSDVLQPIDDASWGDAIRDTLQLHIAENAEGGERSWLATSARLPPELACNLEVVLVRDGAPLSVTDFWLARRNRSCQIRNLSPLIVRGRKSPDGLALRLRGTSANVLRDWDATHYWTGEIEIPVAELVGRGRTSGAK